MIVSNVTCDKCGVTHELDDIEVQEFIGMEFDGGYGAPFGDGVKATLDLCDKCQIELFGKYVQYPDGEEPEIDYNAITEPNTTTQLLPLREMLPEANYEVTKAITGYFVACTIAPVGVYDNQTFEVQQRSFFDQAHIEKFLISEIANQKRMILNYVTHDFTLRLAYID